MIKLENFKKSVLLSFAIIFLAIVILMLAILLFKASLESGERLSELGILDRVYDLDSSLQKSFRDIFQEAQIIVNVTNTSVSFEEDLPNNDTDFVEKMNNFKNFVEGNDEHMWLNISKVVEELPLFINPYNITYKHINFSSNKIRILPNEINFDAISVYARINGNVTSCDFDVESGGLRLDVEIAGDYGTSCSNSMLIDPYEDSDIKINVDQFTVYIDDGIFDIISNKSTARVKTELFFNETKNVKVEYPGVVVHIDFRDFKIAKRGHVRIK